MVAQLFKLINKRKENPMARPKGNRNVQPVKKIVQVSNERVMAYMAALSIITALALLSIMIKLV